MVGKEKLLRKHRWVSFTQIIYKTGLNMKLHWKDLVVHASLSCFGHEFFINPRLTYYDRLQTFSALSFAHLSIATYAGRRVSSLVNLQSLSAHTGWSAHAAHSCSQLLTRSPCHQFCTVSFVIYLWKVGLQTFDNIIFFAFHHIGLLKLFLFL